MTTVLGTASHKPTSAEYGLAYQRGLAEKYRNRADNHWHARIRIAHELADRWAFPRLSGREPSSINVLDIGCSIGTFAIEFARRGCRATGVDLDTDAIAIAKELAGENGVSPEFVHGDVSAWTGRVASIDIAVAFDLFEHLHDDELGALLRGVRGAMSEQGTLLFHTFPTEFDYLFFEDGGRLSRELEAYAACPPEEFERLTRALALRLDAQWLERRGQTQRERIERSQHCNPLTRARLERMLTRAGFECVELSTSQLYPFRPEQQAKFAGQPIVDRNLFGAAIPRSAR